MGKNGGARPGAGRKAGTRITKTQELIARATEGGATPMEVLVKSMRFYHGLAEDAVVQLQESQNAKQKAKIFKVVNHLKSLAKDYAVCAAPYIHPKLAAIDAKIEISGHEDRLAFLK